MKTKLWLSSLTLSFVVGAGGGWYFQAERQSVAPTASPAASAAVVTVKHELPRLDRNFSSSILEINTVSRSYFAKDSHGGLVPELREGKKYFEVREGVYSFSRSIDTGKTALIVMDPWEDSGSAFLNKYYDPIIRGRLIPLIGVVRNSVFEAG